MTFELLWTDWCFLILLGVGLIVTLSSLRKEPIRQSFSIVFQKPLAVSSGIILLFYLVIAVLDSVHIESDKKNLQSTMSLLDKIVSPIGEFYEKTYSSPFALHSFVTETELLDGVLKQIYPRLNYPPNSIKTAEEKQKKIHSIVVDSLLSSTYIVMGVIIGVLLLKKIMRRKSIFRLSASAISAIATLFCLLFLTLASYWLSRDFHLLGTGQIGQDIFYYTLKSIRTGLVIGLLTTLFILPLALLLGIAAGYFGGLIDDIIQYVYTTLSSVPGVLLITASVLSLQTYISNHPEQFDTLAKSADARLIALCIILGVTSWTSLCRLLRAEAMKLREIDFVTAARALGSHWFTIFRKHLLPNVMHIVLITLVLDFSFLVMAEALLSYVGVGVSSTTISWGNMINGARLELARDPVVWWPMFAAFLFMFFLVLAINLFADALRDAFDPHHTNL